MTDRAPNIFLSSTFYDLRQVRADLRDFVEHQLGYRLLGSEYDTFPVDPGVNTLENCRRRVERDADIFVLVVGSRYGTIPEGFQRSITNVEYLAARAKRVPIYAFIQRDVIALLELWEANPAADFSSVVDTVELFSFVRDVRRTDRVWSFPFETAQEIVSVLRIQLAYEVQRCFVFATKLRGGQAEYGDLSGDTLRLAIEKPLGWQTSLVAAVLEREIKALASDRRDFDLGIASGPGIQVAGHAAMGDWISRTIKEADRIVERLNVMLGEVLNGAANGSDVQGLTYGAQAVAAAYHEALEWAKRIRCAHVPNGWAPVIKELSLMLGDTVVQLEVLPARLRSALQELIEHGSARDQLIIRLQIDPDVMRRYSEALGMLRKMHGLEE